MKYKCGIIKDLIPLYIDDVCSEESRTAVKDHLSECEKCRQYYESVNASDGFTENQNEEDIKMADSLKNVKTKINRKIRNIIICSAAAVLVFAAVFYTLFSIPLKEIDLSDISVSAEVYPIDELGVSEQIDDNSVKISFGEKDTSDVRKITVPSMPNADITLSENVMEKNGYVTAVSWSSPYSIKEIKWAKSPNESGDTLYVKSFKTTVLNNKSLNYTMQELEIREINKIVFVDDNGAETVLWSR